VSDFIEIDQTQQTMNAIYKEQLIDSPINLKEEINNSFINNQELANMIEAKYKKVKPPSLVIEEDFFANLGGDGTSKKKSQEGKRKKKSKKMMNIRSTISR